MLEQGLSKGQILPRASSMHRNILGMAPAVTVHCAFARRSIQVVNSKLWKRIVVSDMYWKLYLASGCAPMGLLTTYTMLHLHAEQANEAHRYGQNIRQKGFDFS